MNLLWLKFKMTRIFAGLMLLSAMLQVLPLAEATISESDNEVEQNSGPADSLDDVEISRMSHYLAELLRRPFAEDLPLLYVEEVPQEAGDADYADNRMLKRSRYYRRYPWKRQNSRSRTRSATRYDPDRYVCQPSRDDVFRLLVALHETRQGTSGKTVQFCNRKRPASAIFTNIRFLGRK